MLLRKEIITFYILALVTVVVTFFIPDFLPEKYLYDATIIAEDPFNEKGGIGSYSISMSFYDILKLNTLSFGQVGVIHSIIIFYLIRKLGIPTNLHRFYLSNTLILTLILIIPAYLSMPTKEFLNIVFVFLIVFILKRKKLVSFNLLAVVFALFFLFGFYFRVYYALIPFVAVAVSIISNVKTKFKTLNVFFISVLSCVFISLSYGFVKGEFMSSSSREQFNETRVGREDSQTLIMSPIKTDTALGEAAGIFYGYFSVNIPLNGLKYYKKPQVLFFVFWQLLLIVVLLMNFSREIKVKGRTHQKWLFYLLISYLAVQGIFEPDLGSSIRHKLGILPLIYEATFYKRTRI